MLLIKALCTVALSGSGYGHTRKIDDGDIHTHKHISLHFVSVSFLIFFLFLCNVTSVSVCCRNNNEFAFLTNTVPRNHISCWVESHKHTCRANVEPIDMTCYVYVCATINQPTTTGRVINLPTLHVDRSWLNNQPTNVDVILIIIGFFDITIAQYYCILLLLLHFAIYHRHITCYSFLRHS